MKNSVRKMTKLFIMSLAIILANGTNRAYAESGIPQVDRIAAEYAGVREGDTQTFDILSKSPCNVQYRVWLCNKKDNVWQDITKGFTPPMQPKSIYSVRTPKLKEGQYTISVWVKRSGVSSTIDKRGFDSYLATNMNCLKDDGKGPYLTIDNFTHNYEVGQSISISNKNGKDYLYNYNVYDLINRRNVTTSEEYKNEVSWKPGKEGLYLLKVNIKSIEKIPVVVQKLDENKDNVDDNKDDSKNNVIKNNDNINKEIIKGNKEENEDKSLKNQNDKKDIDSEKQVESKDNINNKDNV
ncbi:murein L,D-transpeptidase, partial [Clostridium botulinum C/D]|nr:murein L,D-transpeptidase [Clostridium botulinum C/D]